MITENVKKYLRTNRERSPLEKWFQYQIKIVNHVHEIISQTVSKIVQIYSKLKRPETHLYTAILTSLMSTFIGRSASHEFLLSLKKSSILLINPFLETPIVRIFNSLQFLRVIRKKGIDFHLWIPFPCDCDSNGCASTCIEP